MKHCIYLRVIKISHKNSDKFTRIIVYRNRCLYITCFLIITGTVLMITEYIEYSWIKNCLVSVNRICVNTDNIIKINNSYSYLIKCRITAESAVHIIILSCFKTFIIRIFCCNENRFILNNRSLSCNYRLPVNILKAFKCTYYRCCNYYRYNCELSC